MLKIAVLTSNRAPGLDALRNHPFCGVSFTIDCVMTRRPPRDLHLRESYDSETAALLRIRGVDVVVLLGYLYIITEPLLSAFPGRVLNVHDGDPKYPGLHATRDAILAGERQTRSIVHIVTPDLDAGPLVVRSDPFLVAPFVHAAVAAKEWDIVRAYAYAQREWMMRSTWANLIVEALDRVTALDAAMV
jgi:folate-dependent phosphoribosylglycinamide formyltransferase PurN